MQAGKNRTGALSYHASWHMYSHAPWFGAVWGLLTAEQPSFPPVWKSSVTFVKSMTTLPSWASSNHPIRICNQWEVAQQQPQLLGISFLFMLDEKRIVGPFCCQLKTGRRKKVKKHTETEGSTLVPDSSLKKCLNNNWRNSGIP